MKRLPQILMALSGLLFLVSLTPAGSSIYYGIVKPISAILFVVSFILVVLQKEVALYDAEQRLRITVANVGPPAKAPANSTRDCPQAPSAPLVHAH